jgi:type IV pilus assembly protein PilB
MTGPTGSGKTTTLYSSLDYCNDMSRKVITVEDPVEYQIDGLIQCSIDVKAGRTFDHSLREIVRQDPDIVVLGEIRDKLTAETAIQAALTGHKVYATFHTEDSIGGLVRLLNMQIEAFLISSTVVSIVAQRLLRRLCPKCKQPHTPSPNEVRRLGIKMSELKAYEFYKGQGCSDCNYTGYRGRVGAYELLVIDDNVKEAVLNEQPSHIIRKMCVESSGLVSMREDAIVKVIKGFTSFEEVARHTPPTSAVRPIAELMAHVG